MSSNKKELLFRITKKDLIRQTFRCGGKGGQNVNKVETGVRWIHPASGAIAEGREHRTQLQNEKAAFERLVQTPEFKKWHKIESARRLGLLNDIETRIDSSMAPENLKVEIKVNGKWVEVNDTRTMAQDNTNGEGSQQAAELEPAGHPKPSGNGVQEAGSQQD